MVKKYITIGRIRVMIDFLVATLDLAPVLHASFTKHVRSPQSDRCELETLRPLFSSLRKETYWRERGQNFLVKNKRKGNIMWKYYGKKNITAEKEEKRRDHFTFVFCSDFFFELRGIQLGTWYFKFQPLQRKRFNFFGWYYLSVGAFKIHFLLKNSCTIRKL